MGSQCGVSLLQKADMIGALHEAHMRNGVDERLWRRNRGRPHEVRPELTREVELHIDVECFRNIDASIASRRGVIEFTQRGVTGTGVVPGARALLAFPLQDLEHLDPEIWLKLLQNDAQCRTHDASPDEDDIHFFRTVVVARAARSILDSVHSSTSALDDCRRRGDVGDGYGVAGTNWVFTPGLKTT